MCIDFNRYHSGGSSFVYVNDFWLLQKLFVYPLISSALRKKKDKHVKSPRYMVSYPETSSDPPIGSDRESGCDRISLVHCAYVFVFCVLYELVWCLIIIWRMF